MPGYGGPAYGGGVYGGGGSLAAAASDSWAVGDSAAVTRGLPRPAADGWGVTDAVAVIVHFNARALDALGIADGAASPVNRPRTASDSWTLHEVAKAIFVPYVDLPSHLVLKGDGGLLALEPGGGLVLDPAAVTLRLQSGDDCTLKDEPRGLALKDEPRGVWADG